MTNTTARNDIHTGMEAQRFLARQASRERDTLIANALERMGELVEAGYLAESKRIAKREIEER